MSSELFSPLEAYSSGFVGCRQDKRADEEFVDMILRSGGDPNGASVAHYWDFAGAGAGKLILLFPAVMKIFPGCWPGPTQLTGDCFEAGTMVRMGDGNEKPIEQVKVGDVVVSHTGAKRVVEDTIKKPYFGDIVTLKTKGQRAISCTPDHRFVSDGEAWVAAGDLSVGDSVLYPRIVSEEVRHTFDLEENRPDEMALSDRSIPASSDAVCRWKHMKHECLRHVELDSRLAWLVGLYLAEGSMDVSVKNGDPRRITLNLSAKERDLAEMAAAMFTEIFGVTSHVCQVPSKPSVIYVRVSSPPVAALFKKLAPGNTYTKRLNKIFFSATRAARLGVLRGWFAGDGHIRNNRKPGDGGSYDKVSAVAVSASHDLVRDMFDIANSCSVASAISRRPARKRSREASCLHLYGENAINAFPGLDGEYNFRPGAAAKDGRLGAWKKITSTTRKHFEGDVYCIQVAEDHSFVANGIAVHNCVSKGAANCLLTSLGMEIASGKPDEVTNKVEGPPDLPPAGIKNSVVASESLWAWRGYDGDGWICSRAAQVAVARGFLVRKPYPELGIDLTNYTQKTISLGGSRPPNQKWLDESSKHVARTATVLEGREQVRDFLFQGYGVFNCSAMGFERTRNEDGFSRQVGIWHHSQSYLGYDDRPDTHKKYGQALVLWNNSWAAWNSGPTRVRGTDIDIPPGSFWALASTIDKAQNIALSSVAGWPRRQHTTFGATGNV